MKLCIREMLDGYIEDDIEIGAKTVVSIDIIKEATMKKINLADTHTERHGIRYIILIAAVVALTAAFTLTGYALGWFGLQNAIYTTETTNVSDPTESQVEARSYMSLSGWVGTPEFEANAEWLSFLNGYISSDDNSTLFKERFPDGDAYMEKANYFYTCYDQTMLDKLLSICNKYGLALHTQRLPASSPEELYILAGTGTFILNDENAMMGGYVYEDGSFMCEGEMDSTGGESFGYQLLRNVQGSLSAAMLNIGDANAYEEWSYTTLSGTTVCLDLSPTHALIIYEAEDSFVVVNILTGSEENGEDYAPLTKKGLEDFADTIGFEQIDVGGEPKVLEKANAGPSIAADSKDAITLTAWVEKDEYKAGAAWATFCREYDGGNYRWDIFGSPYPGVYPCYDSTMEAKVQSLCREYNLKAHETMETVYNAEMTWEGMPEDERPQKLLTPEEFCTAVGCGQFIHNGDTMTFADIYKDGSFRLQGGTNSMAYTMTRFTKGTFASSIPDLGDVSAYETWNYKTSSGATVCLVTGAGLYTPSLILYETDTSYVVVYLYNGDLEAYRMEEYADFFDFTQID